MAGPWEAAFSSWARQRRVAPSRAEQQKAPWHQTCPEDLPFQNSHLPCTPVMARPHQCSPDSSLEHLPLHHHLCTAMCPSLLLPLLLSSWGKAVLSVMQTFDSTPSCPNSHSFPKTPGGFGGGRPEGTSLLYRPGKISNGYIFVSWPPHLVASQICGTSTASTAQYSQTRHHVGLLPFVSEDYLKFEVPRLLSLRKATLQMCASLPWRTTLPLPGSSSSSWRFPPFCRLVSNSYYFCYKNTSKLHLSFAPSLFEECKRNISPLLYKPLLPTFSVPLLPPSTLTGFFHIPVLDWSQKVNESHVCRTI